MAAPRILIVRLSAIGDVVHGLPVLCALREAIPDAHLAWLVEGRAADLLRGHRALDELIVGFGAEIEFYSGSLAGAAG